MGEMNITQHLTFLIVIRLAKAEVFFFHYLSLLNFIQSNRAQLHSSKSYSSVFTGGIPTDASVLEIKALINLHIARF